MVPPIVAPLLKRFEHPPRGAVSLLSCCESAVPPVALLSCCASTVPHGAVVLWHFNKPPVLLSPNKGAVGIIRAASDNGSALGGLSKRHVTTAPYKTAAAPPQDNGAVELIVEAPNKHRQCGVDFSIAMG